MLPVLSKEATVLLVADDWGLYRPEEMAKVVGFRAEFGEDRPLIDAPGFVFTSSENRDMGRLVCLLLEFRSFWSFYLYGLSSKFTLLFWEGDFLDIWSRAGFAKAVESAVES